MYYVNNNNNPIMMADGRFKTEYGINGIQVIATVYSTVNYNYKVTNVSREGRRASSYSKGLFSTVLKQLQGQYSFNQLSVD